MTTNHMLFLGTLFGKAALGVIQLISSVAIYAGVLQQMPPIAQWLVQKELSEDPNDFIASKILSLANLVPTANTNFYALYFGAHGLLHIGIVAALLWGARWAHQAAVVVLSAFVIYQLFEWATVGGRMLLILSAIDIFVILLTLRESRERRFRSS